MSMRLLVLILGIVMLNGCVTARTYTIEKPRVDTEISSDANRGYIMGTPKQDPNKKPWLKDTRTLSVLEVELGNSSKKDKMPVQESQVQTSIDQEINNQDELVQSEPSPVVQSDSNGCIEEYVIQKNDTLQKIAKKFYNSSKKWYKLYQANKSVLKNPNRILPGKKICIPDLGKKNSSQESADETEQLK